MSVLIILLYYITHQGNESWGVGREGNFFLSLYLILSIQATIANKLKEPKFSTCRHNCNRIMLLCNNVAYVAPDCIDLTPKIPSLLEILLYQPRNLCPCTFSRTQNIKGIIFCKNSSIYHLISLN
ncbi:hypothetical protein L6164_017034 [Bauhinia variegata]|uniref:Uncharacterized protein n=1 Tax=Bauhinia variegata TaxID=167791 RepID=A0ACB9N6F4_BAUVA|nr:hypothetical protein L6164_017034 [Bauhinia variegata]